MPPESAWAGTFYIPVACFLLFNIGDYLGRFLAGLIMLPRPSKVGSWITLALSILRFVFLPLFLFCNVDPENRGLTSVLFESDTAYIIIMMLFSITNGYVGSICMISGPQVSVIFSTFKSSIQFFIRLSVARRLAQPRV